MTAPLVTPDWLHEALLATSAQCPWCVSRHLDNPGEQVRYHPIKVVDVTWKPGQPEYDAYRESFVREHIPGASFFNLKTLNESRTKTQSPVCDEAFPIPESDLFASAVSEIGVTNDTHVILYDSLERRGPVRAWFLFRLFGHHRVSVLDGGLQRWKQRGWEVCAGDMERSNFRPEEGRGGAAASGSEIPCVFKVTFRPELLRNFEEMKSIVENRSAQIIDARPRIGGFYLKEDDGKATEPNTTNVSNPSPAATSTSAPGAGHMPGAVNMPFTSLFTSDGMFKQEMELACMFKSAGVNLNCPIVATCQKGVTSCALALAGYLLDHYNMAVYNGSWSQWEKRAPTSLVVRTTPYST